MKIIQGALSGMVYGAALIGGITAFFDYIEWLVASGQNFYSWFYMFLIIICGGVGVWINCRF